MPKSMLHIVLSSVACPAVSYFSKLSRKRHDFRIKVIGYKMCILIFSVTLPGKFLILGSVHRDMIKNVFWSSCKVRIRYSCQILVKIEFYRQILEKSSNIRFHKISYSESRVMSCGVTDMSELIFAFRKFSDLT